MSLVKWEAVREIEDMFDRYARNLGFPRGQDLALQADWAPRVDISESDTEFVIKAEIPEVQKEDVKVTLERGVLTIKGERKHESEQKDKKFHRIERSYGSFLRSFTLPDNIDEHNVQANFKDGMLNLQIPKLGEKKSRQIEVTVK
ncbi:MAG: Hsp20/alpha crystallin family protein [Burkholderiales bacterium]|nr:Hsp20/alpha crystallin family protein [Burkholderiales bacterium]